METICRKTYVVSRGGTEEEYATYRDAKRRYDSIDDSRTGWKYLFSRYYDPHSRVDLESGIDYHRPRARRDGRSAGREKAAAR